jgi:hypothetical protein
MDMRTLIAYPLGLLLGLSAALAAANTTAQPAGTAPPKATQPGLAASATAPGPTGTGGGAPNAGGSGGGVGSNKGVSGQQIGPKKPKCPDPTTHCPAEKVIGK